MKATLTFDLETREDQEAHLRAVKSLDLALVLNHQREMLNKLVNDGLPACLEGKPISEIIEWLQQGLLAEMDDRGIVLDDMLS